MIITESSKDVNPGYYLYIKREPAKTPNKAWNLKSEQLFLLPVKFFFRKEKIQFKCRRCSFFLILPMTRTVQVHRVGALYNTCFGCHRSLDAGFGEFESQYRPFSHVFLDTREYVLVFEQQEVGFF